MRWSFQIFRVAGIEVRIHITFLLLLAFLALGNYASGGAAAAVHAVAFVCLVFLCVLLHEFGHALAARRYGIRTPDITLLPIGGLARLERMPEKPSEELVVAIAGPLVNVAIALLLLPFAGTVFFPGAIESVEASMVSKLFTANVMLVLFNLIPAFPMDGGRVLRAGLAFFMPYARATRFASLVGQGFALLFAAAGIFLLKSPMLVFVALFVFVTAGEERALVQTRTSLTGLPVSAAMAMRMNYARATAVAANIGQAIALVGGLWALSQGMPMLVLVAVFIFVGAQNEAAFAQMKGLSASLRVQAATVTSFTSLPLHATLNDAIEALLATSQHDFPVLGPAGEVRGLLTRDDLLVALRKSGADTPVAEVMQVEVPTLHHTMLFDRALVTLQESGCPALPVVDSAGRLVGLFTPENVSELLLVRSALERAPGRRTTARRAEPPPLPA
jgi:Zn-dependent protease